MIILWWLFMASRFPFDYMAQYNDEAKWEEEMKKRLQMLRLLRKSKPGTQSSPGTQRTFSDKVTPDIDSFTDDPVV